MKSKKKHCHKRTCTVCKEHRAAQESTSEEIVLAETPQELETDSATAIEAVSDQKIDQDLWSNVKGNWLSDYSGDQLADHFRQRTSAIIHPDNVQSFKELVEKAEVDEVQIQLSEPQEKCLEKPSEEVESTFQVESSTEDEINMTGSAKLENLKQLKPEISEALQTLAKYSALIQPPKPKSITAGDIKESVSSAKDYIASFTKKVAESKIKLLKCKKVNQEVEDFILGKNDKTFTEEEILQSELDLINAEVEYNSLKSDFDRAHEWVKNQNIQPVTENDFLREEHIYSPIIPTNSPNIFTKSQEDLWNLAKMRQEKARKSFLSVAGRYRIAPGETQPENSPQEQPDSNLKSAASFFPKNKMY